MVMNNIVDLRIAKFHANVSTVIKSASISRNGKLAIEEGRTLELICSAAGQPRPEIYWFKDGRLLIPQKSVRNLIITSNGETSILHIKNVTPWDTGSYACRAENINGHIKKWMQLTVMKERKEAKQSSGENVPRQYQTKNDNARIDVCDSSFCNSGVCYLGNNRTRCNCIAMKSVKIQHFLNREANTSAERRLARNCNEIGCYTFNDQLFTIFETILVCLVAVLFIGIVCFICKSKRKLCYHRAKGYYSRTTQVSLVSITKVRDVGIDTNHDTFECSTEKWLRSPIDRMADLCDRDSTSFAVANDGEQEMYTNLTFIYPPPSKINNVDYKNNNVNYKTFYRSNLADLIYEETYLSEIEPLNQPKETYCNSYRGTMSSDTGYGNSFILTPDKVNLAESQLSPTDNGWSRGFPICNMSHL